MKNWSALFGWALAVAAVALGYLFHGWRGVALAVSGMVFWLLLQFTRGMRAMRAAADAPVGHVSSAVMLQSRLHPGQRLIELIQLTRSLGEKLSDTPERYRWTDAAGHRVEVELRDGRLVQHSFTRAPDPDAPAPTAEPAAPTPAN